MTCSIGVARFPADGNDDGALLRAADVALYCAKAAGRNRWVIHHDDMNQKLVRSRSLQDSLTRALADGTIEPVYQPILSSDWGSTRVEATCRWRGLDGSWLAPAPVEVLRLAESCGRSADLVDWLLRAACRQGTTWQAAGQPATITVDVGLTELLRPDFVGYIEGIVGASRLSPRRLQIGLDETLIGEFTGETLVEKLNGIRALGVGVTIGGFGSGACPLADLPRLPVDEIRIGPALVSGLDKGEAIKAVTAGIVLMAHGLGLRVVAGQVATRRQWRRLVEIGCDGIQGSVVSPPLTAEEVHRPTGAAAAPSRMLAVA